VDETSRFLQALRSRIEQNISSHCVIASPEDAPP
jgi:hypothetical protein